MIEQQILIFPKNTYHVSKSSWFRVLFKLKTDCYLQFKELVNGKQVFKGVVPVNQPFKRT